MIGSSLPPFVVFFAGALLVAVTPARLHRILLLLVPAIATLHATPAWAQTDYTMTAYRYGTNAGQCKNPDFNPNANPGSTAGTEFIDCPTGGSTHEVVGGDAQDPGPIGF